MNQAQEGSRGVVELHRQMGKPATAASLSEIRAELRSFFAEAGLAPEHARLLVLAVDEAVTSIVLEEDACGQAGGSELDIRLDIDPVRFRAAISASTTIYPGLGGEGARDTGATPTERGADEGGEAERGRELAVFLVRRICDEVNYSFRRGYENLLELVWFLPEGDAPGA